MRKESVEQIAQASFYSDSTCVYFQNDWDDQIFMLELENETDAQCTCRILNKALNQLQKTKETK